MASSLDCATSIPRPRRAARWRANSMKLSVRNLPVKTKRVRSDMVANSDMDTHHAREDASLAPDRPKVEAVLMSAGLSQICAFCSLNGHTLPAHWIWAEHPTWLVGGPKTARQVLPSAHRYRPQISSIPNIMHLKQFFANQTRLAQLWRGRHSVSVGSSGKHTHQLFARKVTVRASQSEGF